mmetsp:Transcript_28326/g.37055  ORF Transcript_28326/g.37055 Transcript_28326/m.37055 type:complete len:210 (+) Transcript_28326:312-941(+)
MGQNASTECTFICLQGDTNGNNEGGDKKGKLQLHSRKDELDKIMACDDNEDRDGRVWYIIDAKWVKDWLEYVHHNKDPPGAIENKKLLEWKEHAGWKPRQNLLPGTKGALGDYRRINGQVWKAYLEMYPGSGPTILTFQKPFEDTENWEVDQGFFPSQEKITMAKAGMALLKGEVNEKDKKNMNKHIEQIRRERQQSRSISTNSDTKNR